MKHLRGALCILLLALWIAGLWVTGGLAAVGTQPGQAVRIQDGFHTQLLRIDHNGAAVVTCITAAGVAESCGGSSSGGDAINVFHQSTIRHVSSVTHVAGYGAFHVQGLGVPGQTHGGVLTIQGTTGGVPVPVSLSSGGDAVNVFHQSTIRHISSLTHVVIVDWQRWAHIQASQSGTWNIAAAHQGGQWNIAHITSVVHVAGVVHLQSSLVDSANTAVRVTGVTVFTIMGAVDHISSRVHAVLIPSSNQNDQLKVHGAMAQSGSWSIQAAHQGGEWNLRHVGSYLHVVVVDWQRWAHLQVSQSGTWNVAAAHQGGQWNIAHVTSVTHVRGGVFLTSQAGSAITVTGTALDVNCTGCSVASVVGVTHISSALHIAGTINGAQLHVQGLGIPGQAHGGVLTIQGVTGGVPVPISGTITAGDAVNVFHQSTVRHISSLTHVVIVDWQRWAHIQASQSGTWNIAAAHQGGQWNVQHVGAQLHLAVAQKAGSNHLLVEVQGPHLTGAIHVAGISNIGSGAAGTGTTSMACHSTLAIHVAAAAPGYTQIIHLTSSNGGINQANWRIYICSIMVVSAHAQGFSLLEGTGTTCLGQVRHAVIGSWRPDDSVVLAANGGFSVVSPFPTFSTQVPGNNLCIGQTSRTTGTISGFMSYRAGP